MIMLLLALVAAAAPAPPDPVLDSSSAYRDCLDGVTTRALRQKMEVGRYEEEAGRACATEARTFRTVMIDVDLKAGLGRADAEREATQEARDMLELAKALFADLRSKRR
jgi:hypothetical protein